MRPTRLRSAVETERVPIVIILLSKDGPMIAQPFAVAWLPTSMHRPDSPLVMFPFGSKFHTWLAVPLQV